MPNPENLVPLNNRTKTEQRKITQMGGIASGEARRKKKQRGDILREIVNTEITNEKMLNNLRALGIFKEHPTLEDYINATATKDMTKKASMQDLQRMNEEIYGPNKQQVELSGEVTGITINVKKYDKEGK
ncbi:hypothetical protein IJH24_03535 [Candidatus Saccharibacteria bacterium]|nr:hypothetical protein [Candidatus Saccharibacteria bacterium]